jgi:hypothetical protein
LSNNLVAAAGVAAASSDEEMEATAQSMLASLKAHEDVINDEAEVNMGEATQTVFELSNHVGDLVKDLAAKSVGNQQRLRAETATISARLESFIDSSTTMSRELKRVELEASSLPNLESWLRNVTAEVSHMKAQVLFLSRTMNVEEKGAEKKGGAGGKPPG